MLSGKVCGRAKPSQLPSHSVSANTQGFSVMESEEAVTGSRMGDTWEDTGYFTARRWSGSCPDLAFHKRNGWFYAGSKNPQTSQSIPKGYQKGIGRVTQRFPIAFGAVQPYLGWVTHLALSFLTNLQTDHLSPQISRTVTLTVSPWLAWQGSEGVH